MPREHLILFTRYPVAGKAKTRLIPAIGADAAADLHRELTELTLRRAISVAIARGVGIEVRYDGGDAQLMRDWLGPMPRYTPQGEGDLGQRLARAAQDSFAGAAESVVIIGTDCPRLDEGILQEAFEKLRGNDAVFGPAQDGGYYLVGLRKPMPTLFQGIPWSTSSVLSESLRIARASLCEPVLLVTLPDVDEPADLVDWQTLQEAVQLRETTRHFADTKPHQNLITEVGSANTTATSPPNPGHGTSTPT